MNIAFVPVRCGSKAIEWKNIKKFCGRPLVYWCLKALEECQSVDKIYAATDCNEIADIISGFKFLKTEVFYRESKNATSESSTEAVMLEFLSRNSFSIKDRFILVQATNPFIEAQDITMALSNYQEGNFDSMLSCCRIRRFFWRENGTPANYDYNKRPRRQDFKGELVENGSFYINTIENILESKNRLSGRIGIYEMPEYSFIEIDEIEDWIAAEQIFRKHRNISQEKAKIKLLLTDVDGVLTDSGMYYSESGDELKKFSTYDGMAFGILKKAGIKTGIITSENRQLNANRAKKLGMNYIFQGARNKLKILEEICQKEGIDYNDVAYVGDDINDVEILEKVGMAACPSSARFEVKSIHGIRILESKGGEGVIRELADKYIEL